MLIGRHLGKESVLDVDGGKGQELVTGIIISMLSSAGSGGANGRPL